MIFTIMYISLFLFSLIYALIIQKTFLRINFIYTCLWCLGGVIVGNGYCGLYKVDDVIHWYIILSIFVFNIVYILESNEEKNIFIPNWDISKKTYRAITILNYCAYIFMIPIIYRAINILTSKGWFFLRTLAYSTDGVMVSEFQFYFYSWIINPIFTATMLIAAITFFSNYIYRKRIFILSIIDILIITIAFGGRYNLIKFVLFFVISFLIKRKYMKKNLKISKRYIFAIMIAILVIIYLTSLRSFKGLSFIENMVIYLYGSIVYFNMIISPKSINNTRLYGNATFGIFTSLPLLFIMKVFGKNMTPEFLVKKNTSSFIYISDTYRYNALTSWLYPFWRDGGAFGIIIGVWYIVTIYSFLSKMIVKKSSLTFYALLIYIVFTIIMSTMAYRLMTIQETITIIVIICFTRGAKLKEDNKEMF